MFVCLLVFVCVCLFLNLCWFWPNGLSFSLLPLNRSNEYFWWIINLKDINIAILYNNYVWKFFAEFWTIPRIFLKKRLYRKNYWKQSGVRICHFGSEIVKIDKHKKKFFSSIQLCIVGELAGGGYNGSGCWRYWHVTVNPWHMTLERDPPLSLFLIFHLKGLDNL